MVEVVDGVDFGVVVDEFVEDVQCERGVVVFGVRVGDLVYWLIEVLWAECGESSVLDFVCVVQSF